MKLKRLTFIVALFALLAAGVSAHDVPSLKGYALMSYGQGDLSPVLDDPILLEATGLDEEALRAALMEGSTVTELIEANEGDVETVIVALVAQSASASNERAATAIDGLDEGFSEALNESYRHRFPWSRRRNPVREVFGAWDMGETLLDATGLDAAELNTALLEGSTLAELVEANEGDVATVVSELVAQATDGIHAAAAASIERYEESIREVFDTDFAEVSRRWRRGRPGPRGFFGFWGMTSTSTSAAAEVNDS